jgi:hypothetical protein
MLLLREFVDARSINLRVGESAVARPITPPLQCVHLPLPPQIAQTRPSPCTPVPLQTRQRAVPEQ